MAKNSVHVIPNDTRSGWSVKKSDAKQASLHMRTKTEAIKMGRIISQRSGSELIIYGEDGKVQRSDSCVKCACHMEYKK